MPKDTIKRAIERGAGGGEGSSMQEIRYEGYGPAGIAAILVDCLTDNRNRTAAEVRHAFTKHGGNLGTSGSVAFQFKLTGINIVSQVKEDEILDIALENGADDVEFNDDGSAIVYCEPSMLDSINSALKDSGHNPNSSENTYIADNKIKIKLEDAEKLSRLLQKLDDCDDVQDVYHNAEIPDDAQD